jgi:LysM repeat protein
MLRWKRLFYYVLLNVLVSTFTVLVVLTIWNRIEGLGMNITEPVEYDPGQFPTITSPPEVVITPKPTLALQTYQVSVGETLSDIALAFDISIDELMKINGIVDPNALGEGAVLIVPITEDEDISTETPTAIPVGQPTLEDTPERVEQVFIEIVAVIGAGDINSERVQIRGTGSVPLLLTGWQLEDESGNVYIFPKINLYNDGAVDLYTKAGIDTVVSLYWGRSESIWDSGELVTLVDTSGQVQATYRVP